MVFLYPYKYLTFNGLETIDEDFEQSTNENDDRNQAEVGDAAAADGE